MKFKKSILLTITILLLISILVACTPKPSGVGQDLSQETNGEKVELLVSAAASMTDVLAELAIVYKDLDPNTELIFTFGPSGGLQAQIEEGAPVDIFISAAQKQMNALDKKNLLVEDTVKTLLVNKVVLITPKEDKIGIKSFDDLTSNDQIQKIALGDSSNVPVGQYSEEIFTTLGVLDQIIEKAIYGGDVRTVLTWVENGEVDAGLVYATDAMTTDKVIIVGEAPQGSHKEVTYPVGVIKTSKHIDQAKSFLGFLESNEAGEVFKKYGFSIK
jgi:molybdate transport system substrate-binding protein